MQENYRSEHGGYSGNFLELGVPMGARLQGDDLLWEGEPYRVRFSQVIRDQVGKVMHYKIEAKPDHRSWRLPELEIDDSGRLKRSSLAPSLFPSRASMVGRRSERTDGIGPSRGPLDQNCSRRRVQNLLQHLEQVFTCPVVHQHRAHCWAGVSAPIREASLPE